MRVEPLGEGHDRAEFRCGVDAFDRYFKRQAGQDVRRRVASCFVLTDSDTSKPLGFYTLAATSIALAELPEHLAKRLPRYPLSPRR